MNALASLELPRPVAACVARLRAAGGRALLVGGAVRDTILGVDVGGDWDLATTLPPDALRAALPDGTGFDPRLGALVIPATGLAIVVTSMREEGDYRDHRHPGWVEFVTDVAVDAGRRDFTINAIYFDPAPARTCVDPLGGCDDLAARRLRAIGDPRTRLAEDPLRILRGVRFAARYALSVEAATAQAMRELAPELRHLAPRRRFEEVDAMLRGSVGRGAAIEMLASSGLLEPVCGALARSLADERLGATCRALDALPADAREAAWVVLLREAPAGAAVLPALGAPHELGRSVAAALATLGELRALPRLGPAARRQRLRDGALATQLAALRAVERSVPGSVPELGSIEQLVAAGPPDEPPWDGRDVVAAGVPPGPGVGAVLRALDERLAGAPMPSRREALALISELAAPFKPDDAAGR